MMVFANNIIGYYSDSNEFYTVAFVVMVVFLFVLYRIYMWLKHRSSDTMLHDSTIHTMHNYTFNFQYVEVATEKKVGIRTKTILWGLILFFVVTPMYDIITLLEPLNFWSYGIMNCFSGLQ